MATWKMQILMVDGRSPKNLGTKVRRYEGTKVRYEGTKVRRNSGESWLQFFFVIMLIYKKRGFEKTQ